MLTYKYTIKCTMRKGKTIINITQLFTIRACKTNNHQEKKRLFYLYLQPWD